MMDSRLIANLCVALLLVSRTVSAQTAQSLFDGSTLTGWDGDSAYWRVDGGALVGEIPAGTTLDHNTWLVWRGGELADFDLRLKVKLTGLPAANSGIQFRCQVDSINHVSGYQADLDQGATWLGRIYDEHGRALLVERGSRVHITPDGAVQTEPFAPAQQYAVLFRENDWNDYRIVAIGDHIAVYVNGTLFSELRDEQTGEQDLRGQLAFQLHSGPQTRVEFRDITLQTLDADNKALAPFAMKPRKTTDAADAGLVPIGADGQPVELGFESGNLAAWTATGDAFDRQPVNADGISQRWPGQVSNKQGEFFIGGYEHVFDRGRGTLSSAAIRVTHPFISFWLGGGQEPSTRAEVVLLTADGAAEEAVLASVSGRNQEQMRRVAVDVSSVKDRLIRIRLVDENAGAWGHLNFDDVRMHDSEPANVEGNTAWRSTFNPVLQHLVPNVVEEPATVSTLASMHVPPGFSVDLIAAEPDIHQPIAFTFDDRGRLWVVEAHSYPQKRPAGEGLDKIIVLEDTNRDGSFEKRTVFMEGLNLVSGIEVGYGGVWIGAAPELLFIPDRDGDCVPDGIVANSVVRSSSPLPRIGGEGQGEGAAGFGLNAADQSASSSGLSATFSPEAGEKKNAGSDIPPAATVLLDGFDYADTHETLNSFTWGPDGWLYGNQGVFNTSHIGKPGASADERITMSAGVWRYHPTKHVFEVFAHGGSNPWGLDFDKHGQLFMTHCRSYWGQGGTTHVMPGGHYWNQSNAGYAPFVCAEAPSQMPWMKNYLLASARYDHGEGGAGKPGTDAVYGGHSPVGTMIYLGNNWPAEYHNHLFTLNLHGHQMNHQVNEREAGGYNTRHAGTDVFFCGDRSFVGVDLQFGPDGAVYFTDWSDQRHCHNPDTEQWDRSNGRIYRMKYDATWEPGTSRGFFTAPVAFLVDCQGDVNESTVRATRLLLHEYGRGFRDSSDAIPRLTTLATGHPDPVKRLHGVWGLNSIGLLTPQTFFHDDSEYVRSWAVRLAVDDPDIAKATSLPLADELNRLAEHDPSLMVLRSLASAVQRLPEAEAWSLAEALAKREEAMDDRDLPSLMWFGIAQRMPQDVPRALRLARTSTIPALRENILWYAAKLSVDGRGELVTSALSKNSAVQLYALRLLELAVRGSKKLAAPANWASASAALYDSDDAAVRRLAESIGAAFGDADLYRRLRSRLQANTADLDARRHAISVLAADNDPDTLAVLLPQLDVPELVSAVIPVLSRFNEEAVPPALLDRLATLSADDRARAIDVLAGRAAWSHQLLDRLKTDTTLDVQLTAFHARQMASLGDAALTERLRTDWGALGQTSEQLLAEIRQLSTQYKAAPLWAYDGNNGAAHFKKLCAQCHLPNDKTEAIAPKLAGSGTKGVEYIVENIVNPNAVIGRNYQARVIVTTDGRVLTGLIEQESDTSLTIRTLNSSETVARQDIEEMQTSPNSFMPEGLLKTLNDRERIELLKYLMAL